MIFSISGFSMPERVELQEQTVAEVERADAEGSKDRTSAIAFSTSASFSEPRGADLVARDAQVSVLVDVADEVRGDLPDLAADASDIESCQVR